MHDGRAMKRLLSCSRFLLLLGSLLSSLCLPAAGAAPKSPEQGGDRPPNFIVIFVDDLGYGDIGPFGSKANRTPALDRMAQEGTRFTDFYVSASICSPSRASLMTGCYPLRVDLHESSFGVFVLCPMDRKGLNPAEVTLPEILKQQGYATACIGKWHLGDQQAFLPTRHGFDTYFGIPYSNDMGRRPNATEDNRTPALPLMRDETVIEAPVDQTTITRRYTEEAVKFIRAHRDEPFFLYLPHTAVHLPLVMGDDFFGKSNNGVLGDSIEEVDWSTGQLLDTLRELGIEQDTVVVFTSDNGGFRGASNGPFSGGKATVQEGGFRVSMLAWGPGHIPAGRTCEELTTSMDLLPTFARMAGSDGPQGVTIDGHDIGPLLRGEPGAKTPHEAFHYYFMDQLKALRSGKWKLYLELANEIKTWTGKESGPAAARLYDLEADPGEQRNVIADHPEVVARLNALAEQARAEIGDYQVRGRGFRPTLVLDEAKPLPIPEEACRPWPEPPLGRPERERSASAKPPTKVK